MCMCVPLVFIETVFQTNGFEDVFKRKLERRENDI